MPTGCWPKNAFLCRFNVDMSYLEEMLLSFFNVFIEFNRSISHFIAATIHSVKSPVTESKTFEFEQKKIVGLEEW